MQQGNIRTELEKTHTKGEVDRLFLISLRKNYTFCPISKVGNSSLKAFLFEAEYRVHGLDRLISKLNTATVHDVFYGPLILPLQLSPDHFLRTVSGDRFFKFVFVRNPVDRFLSCFLDRVQVPGSAVHKSVCANLGVPKGSQIPLDAFVELVSGQTPREMNPHWRIQYFECGYDQIKYDKVYKFEKFSDGVSDVLQRFYPTVAADINTAANYSPAVTKAKNRKSDILTPDIEKKIRKIYEADFEAFSY